MSVILKDFFYLHLVSRIEKQRLGVDGHHTSMVHDATTVQDHFQTLVSIDDIRKRAVMDIANKNLAAIEKNCEYVVRKYYNKKQNHYHLSYLNYPLVLWHLLYFFYICSKL